MIPAMKSALAVMLLLPASAIAQSHDHSGHQAAMQQAAPTEGGQGAFAALAEIVALLSADPHTDWSKVDIGALRQHLQDMNELVLNVVVAERAVPGGLEMTISRQSPGAEAAWRMVPAHGPVVAAETGWNSKVQTEDDTLVWTVTSEEAEAQVRSLGFFGLMATGNHHSQHHLALARGQSMH